MKQKIEKLKILYNTSEQYSSVEIALMEKINELIDAFNNEEEKPRKRWKPKEGEKYWEIDLLGRVIEICWNNDDFDKNRYNFGNVFCTEKEAEEAREKIKELLNKL